jgi:hypothetical protein
MDTIEYFNIDNKHPSKVCLKLGDITFAHWDVLSISEETVDVYKITNDVVEYLKSHNYHSDGSEFKNRWSIYILNNDNDILCRTELINTKF